MSERPEAKKKSLVSETICICEDRDSKSGHPYYNTHAFNYCKLQSATFCAWLGFTWRGFETVDAGTCSQELLRNASRGSSSNTWRTRRGSPVCSTHPCQQQSQKATHFKESWAGGSLCDTPSPYRGPQQGWTFSSLKFSHTSASLWQPTKEQWQSSHHC